MDALTDLLTRTSPWVGVLCLVLCLATGLWLGLRGSRRRVERRTAGHRRLGRAGSARALGLLTAAGYRVLDTETTAWGRVAVDGEPQTYLVRCDARVERSGRQFIAEFKGGAASARIETRATRRQLLEYAWVFDVEAVLLVDADAGRIRTITFPTAYDAASRDPRQ